jgi:hypothetical protein
VLEKDMQINRTTEQREATRERQTQATRARRQKEAATPRCTQTDHDTFSFLRTFWVVCITHGGSYCVYC